MSTNHQPHICPVLRYQDAPAAIDWLVRTFGFEKHSDHRTHDGAVAHADLRFGPSVVGVSSAGASAPESPWSQVRQGTYVVVQDPDAAHARAVAAGAEIVIPLKDMDYGSRDFSLRDPEGYLWAFGTYDMGVQAGEPTIWTEARYGKALPAVEWLEKALGFRRTAVVPDEKGDVMHAELRLGAEAVHMLGPGGGPDSEWSDTRMAVHIRVEDPDAHCASARKAGATLLREPQTAPYGARFYAVRDAEGFVWWVSDYSPPSASL